MARKTGKTVVRKKKNAVVEGMSAGEYAAEFAGAGSKEVGQEEMALPFIGILQALSPQLSKREDAYIAEAGTGMFHESVSSAIWDGEEGMMIIPCYFSRHIIEWVMRKHGGGFIAAHGPDMKEAIRSCQDRDKHDLVDTHQQAVLVKLPDGTWTEALFPLKSTGLTPSRRWNTEIARQVREIDGQVHNRLPRFWSIWKATTAEKSNDKGTFFVMKTPELQVDLFDMGDEGGELLTRARAFQEICEAGTANVDWRRMDDSIPEAEAEEDTDAPKF